MGIIEEDDNIVIQKRKILPSSGRKVAIVSINRPRKKNCFNTKVANSLSEIFRSLQNETDEDLAAIIFTGEGSSFCAGADLSNPPSPIIQSSDLPEHLFNNPTYQMSLVSIPIIAALRGFVITGGFELALACDILVGDETVTFRDTHCKFNLAPCWGLSQRLQRRVGVGRAKMISFGAIPIKASQARAWGLLDVLTEKGCCFEKAMEIADSIGKNSPDMVVRYKRAIDEGGGMTLNEGLKRERSLAISHYIEIVQDNETFSKAKEFISDDSRPRSKL